MISPLKKLFAGKIMLLYTVVMIQGYKAAIINN